MTIFADANVSPNNKLFKDSDHLIVRSVFGPTFQGEAPFAGYPAIFVRLGGCNIGAKALCPWCDTDFRMNQSQSIHIKDVAQKIKDLIPSEWEQCLVVISGGEPLLQAKNLLKLMKIVHEMNDIRIDFQFETNGQYSPAPLYDFARGRVKLVVSPKSHPNKERNLTKIDPEIKQLALHYNGNVYFRWVIESKGVYSQPHEFWSNYSEKTWLSPVMVYKKTPPNPYSIWDDWQNGWHLSMRNGFILDVAATQANFNHAQKLALEYGVRLSMQTHNFFGVE